MELLLDRGADPTIPGKYDKTPLMAAALFGWTEVVRCLLGYEAEAATINYGRGMWTAVASAGRGGHGDTVRVLLKAGADPIPGCHGHVYWVDNKGKYECIRLFEVSLAKP